MNLDPTILPLLVAMILMLLNYIGKLLKCVKWIDNRDIPKLLGILGGIIGYIVFRDVNAVLLGLSSVGVHQAVKQAVKKVKK